MPPYSLMLNNGYTYTDRITRAHAGLTVLDYPGDPGYILHSLKLRYTDPFTHVSRNRRTGPRGDRILVTWACASATRDGSGIRGCSEAAAREPSDTGISRR